MAYDSDIVAAMNVRIDGDSTGVVRNYPTISSGVPRGIDNESVVEMVGDGDFESELGLWRFGGD